MSIPMKLLIGYDGSACAEIALKDLHRAGLPAAVYAVVLTVTDDLSNSGWSNRALRRQVDRRISAANAAAFATQLLDEAAAVARVGASLLQADFPYWTVQSQILAELPAWGLLWKSAGFQSDLLVVGTNHHELPHDQMIGGSVASAVLSQAPCSVRIARDHGPELQRPLRILIGFDGSSSAEDAVKIVAQRCWPKCSDARLVMVLDTRLCSALIPTHLQSVPRTKKTDQEAQARAEQIVGAVRDSIVQQNPALTVSMCVLQGDPKRILLEEAARWGADSIFLGATGHSQSRHQMLGSVALAVATHAHCSVEVVRSSQGAFSTTVD